MTTTGEGPGSTPHEPLSTATDQPLAGWYPVCRVGDLRAGPFGTTLMDTPIAVFRDRSGGCHALEDRCPHRNLPLSFGRVTDDGSLECAYHGWRFDGAGRCLAVPGLTAGEPATGANPVPTHPCTEQDGFVWVWGDRRVEPYGTPVALPDLGEGGSDQVVFQEDFHCPLIDALENALDVPHTAFLHRGLFRGGSTASITAERRALDGGIEVSYRGEPVRFAGLHLPGPARTFEHWDRFLLPSVAQVEYRIPGWLRLVNTMLHLPVSADRTRAWYVVRFSSRVPRPVVAGLVRAQGRRILAQDANVLERQQANVRRFAGPRYASTDLDVMGPAMRALIEAARHGRRDDGSAPTTEPPPARVVFDA